MEDIYIVTQVTDVIDDRMESVVAVCDNPWDANKYMNEHSLTEDKEEWDDDKWYEVESHNLYR